MGSRRTHDDRLARLREAGRDARRRWPGCARPSASTSAPAPRRRRRCRSRRAHPAPLGWLRPAADRHRGPHPRRRVDEPPARNPSPDGRNKGAAPPQALDANYVMPLTTCCPHRTEIRTWVGPRRLRAGSTSAGGGQLQARDRRTIRPTRAGPAAGASCAPKQVWIPRRTEMVLHVVAPDFRSSWSVPTSPVVGCRGERQHQGRAGLDALAVVLTSSWVAPVSCSARSGSADISSTALASSRGRPRTAACSGSRANASVP